MASDRPRKQEEVGVCCCTQCEERHLNISWLNRPRVQRGTALKHIKSSPREDDRDFFVREALLEEKERERLGLSDDQPLEVELEPGVTGHQPAPADTVLVWCKCTACLRSGEAAHLVPLRTARVHWRIHGSKYAGDQRWAWQEDPRPVDDAVGGEVIYEDTLDNAAAQLGGALAVPPLLAACPAGPPCARSLLLTLAGPVAEDVYGDAEDGDSSSDDDDDGGAPGGGDQMGAAAAGPRYTKEGALSLCAGVI